MASKLLLVTVFIFDLIAFGLAVAAEQRRSTFLVFLKATVQPDSEKNYNYCIYDSDIASGYGVGAFLFLLASQVLIMCASKCFCCGKPLSPGGSRACAVILFITCWVFFFIAEICLFAGSIRNAYHTRYRNFFAESLDCPSLRKGVFAAGASFTLFTAIVSEFYYVCYSKARDSFHSYGGDVGVGSIQFVIVCILDHIHTVETLVWAWEPTSELEFMKLIRSLCKQKFNMKQINFVGIAMASTLVFMAIFAADFIAFVLALEAEYMRSTAKVATDTDMNYSYCVYSSDISTKLGIIAFVLLLASQVFSMGASSYFRKGMNYGGSRTSAVIPSIISWITFFIAEACLLGGSIKNAQQTKYRTIIFGTNELHCQTLSAGVFEAGAAFILITSIVSKMSYVCSFNSEGGFESGSSSSFELGTYTSLDQGDQHN
ncbi:hypothetical protein SADUNF_Sadunf16G0266900 [Salix dunnii]|uniref:Uncharacterized protein n=1 Tax=Salix dunnii TaxID=1413687 RepID=A0A835JBX1_9ROSI|nr:hypothetical protein SADUNF_Sadunf16G0266900 [Salix dunnii]